MGKKRVGKHARRIAPLDAHRITGSGEWILTEQSPLAEDWVDEPDAPPERSGWVKFHRRFLDHAAASNINAFVLFWYCIANARRSARTILVNNQPVHLQPGQLIYGRKSFSKRHGVSEQSARTALSLLVKLECLTKQSTTGYTIITVCNYSTYQQQDQQPNQAINQRVTKAQPKGNQGVTNAQPQREKGEKVKNTTMQTGENGGRGD